MRMTHYFQKLYSWLLPYTCVLCHYPSTHNVDLCKPCLSELPILPYSCPQCARPLSANHICGECLRETPPYQAAFALFSYEDCVKKLILNLKFNDALINAAILGKLLTQKIAEDWYANQSLPDVIIPMPLHPKRLKERGFNQAIEIARPIAKSLQLPLDIFSCQRIKHTVAQATLPAEKRRENIKNAFLVTSHFIGKHIAVLDDVITTGYTILEFTKVLKKAGARQIDVWSCARAIKI
jgi:ComF family protein